MLKQSIPVTIITGFLGAGKTTLLRKLLLESQQKLAVVVNEFGSVGLDGELLKTCGFCPDDQVEERIVELNNGCLCCTVQDDFLPTIENLVNLTDKLDGIIIETSGLALPGPLLKALDWPAIRTRVYLNGVITVVDGEALSNGSPVGDMNLIKDQRQADTSIDHETCLNELFSDQLKFSDMILISRSDLLSVESLSDVKNYLTSFGTYSPLIPISMGDIDPYLILGLNSNIEKVKDIATSEEEDHHHHHLKVNSGSIRVEIDFSQNEIKEFLIEMVLLYQIIRLKGRLWIPGKAIPLQIQMVGDRFNSWFEQAPETSWKPDRGGIDLNLISFQEGVAELIQGRLERRS